VILLQASDNEPDGDVRTMVTQLAKVLVGDRRPLILPAGVIVLGRRGAVPDDASSASPLMKNGDIAM
jgi:hypothetical protein